jgi:hypothetical protein
MKTEWKIALFGLLVLLLVCCTGCTPWHKPEPEVVVHEVQVPVSVPCLKDVPAVPQYEYKAGVTDKSDGEVLLLLSRDFATALTYEAKLRASQAGCKEMAGTSPAK